MRNNRMSWRRTCAITLFVEIAVILPLGRPAKAQPVIGSVTPNSAQPGDSNMSVVATLSGPNLPPDRAQPTSFEIGTVSGRNITRNSTQVSADFDFHIDHAEDVYDVTVTFPSPRGDLVLTLVGGFSVGSGSTSNGLILKTADNYVGYTLFAPMGQTTTYLVDHNGNVSHTWESGYSPNLSAYLLDDGSILRTASNAGAAGDQKLFGQHDAQWVNSDYPGEDNILVFNNGQRRTGGNYSSVEEIVPPLSGYNYTLSPGSAWGPAAATWTYADSVPTGFYADHIAGTQRLPNGNTLICDGPAGEFFEVTSSGEIVWGYFNPYSAGTRRGDSVEVFRATRFALDAEPIIALGLNNSSPPAISVMRLSIPVRRRSTTTPRRSPSRLGARLSTARTLTITAINPVT